MTISGRKRTEILTPHRVNALRMLHVHRTLTLINHNYCAPGGKPSVRGVTIADLLREGYVAVDCIYRGVGQRMLKVARLTTTGAELVATLMAEEALAQANLEAAE